jgi:hypothetical protein
MALVLFSRGGNSYIQWPTLDGVCPKSTRRDVIRLPPLTAFFRAEPKCNGAQTLIFIVKLFPFNLITTNSAQNELLEDLWPITANRDGMAFIVTFQDRTLTHLLELDGAFRGNDEVPLVYSYTANCQTVRV